MELLNRRLGDRLDRARIDVDTPTTYNVSCIFMYNVDL